MEMQMELQKNWTMIYRSEYWAPDEWIVDCEKHWFTAHSGLFADAVGRALLHRYEAHGTLALAAQGAHR